MATISDLAAGIAQFEGFNTPGSIAARNNNPGNLRSWSGVPVGADGFAVFPDPAAGWSALESQINLNMGRGLTLNEFFAGKPGVYAGYAPAADSNKPGTYAATVAGWLGISPDVPLSDVLGAAAPDDTAVSSSPGAWASDLTGGSDLSGVIMGAAAVGVVALLWLIFRR